MKRDAFRFRHLAFHTHESGQWEILFKEIDEKGFLVAQAAHLEGYAQTSEDLERYALPAAVALGDWDRFLRYALIAINLRDVAESLARSEVLEALALSGQDALARNLAAQLADAGTRALARAVLAARCTGEKRARAVREVLDDLRALPAVREDVTSEPPELTTLLAVAASLGPDLLNQWPSLLAKLGDRPDLRSRVWLAVAAGCRASGGGRDAGFRAALRRIEDRWLLFGSLPAWLAEDGAADPGLVREVVREIADPDGALLWHCLLAALDHKARSAPEAALELWDQQRATGPPVPWSIALLEAGGALFTRLDPAGADRLTREFPDVTLRAALRVVRLEGQPAPGLAREALQAVGELPGAQQLHWMLRVLAAWPEKESPERRRLTLAIVTLLARLRYAAPPTDLRSFLDLVADALPGELRHQVESVLRSPAGSPELLEVLVEQAESPALLRQLSVEAESHATVVCPTEAAAFELRFRILVRLGCRLALTADGSERLAEVAARLLPEERDELYAKVARLLYENGRAEDAFHALDEIRSRRLAVTTALAIQANPPGQEGLFDPGALYKAVATVDFAEDERLALLALAQPPLDAESLLDNLLVPMRDRARQAQAVVDLARWTLEFEQKFFRHDQRDLLSPRQLVRYALSATGSDEHLLALALDLLDLASPLAPAAELVEFRETVDFAMLGLEQVSWPARRRALGEIFRRVRSSLHKHEAGVSHCLAAAELINSIVALADGDESSPGRRRFGAHWDEVLVLVSTAVERLPWLVRVALERPLLARPWGQWLSRIIPACLRERFRTPWASGGDAFVARWSWLDDEQKAVVSLCFKAPERRREHASSLLHEAHPSPCALRALVYLCSQEAPDLVSDLLSRLPAGAERDDLCLDLVRNGWLASEHAEKLTPWIGGRWHQLAAEVFRPEEPAGPVEREGWIRSLGELISRCGLDPSDPAVWPALRRLRTVPADEARRPLASAVLEALQRGGRRGGEAAFRFWLNTHLAPSQDPGEEAGSRAERALVPIQEALSLSPADTEERGDGPQQPAPGQSREQLTSLYRRWRRAARRGVRKLRPWLERDKMATLFVLGSTLVLLSLDEALLGDMWRSSDPPPALPWQLFALGLPALFLANALLIDASCETHSDRETERAWRVWRFLLSGIPLLGLYALSALPSLHRPREDPAHRQKLESLPAPRRNATLRWFRAARKLRDLGGWWLLSDTGLVIWLFVNAGFLFLASFGLTRTPGTPAGWMIASSAICLHILTFGALLSIVWTENRRSQVSVEEMAVGMAFSCVVLVPFPFIPLLGYFIVFLILPDAAKQTLARAARDQSAAARGLPRWLSLEGKIRAAWKGVEWPRRWRRPVVESAREPGEAWWQLLQLCRKKSVLLHFECAVFSWLLLQLGDRFKDSWFLLIPQVTCLFLLFVSPLVGAGALILTALRFVRRIAYVDGEAHASQPSPYPFLLAASQLACFSGLCLGGLLREGNAGAIAGLYLVIAGFGLAALFPPFLLSLLVPLPPLSQRDERARMLWSMGFAGLGISAVGFLFLPSFRSLSFSFSPWLVLFVPLCFLVDGLVDGGWRWLLRPFQPRQILERDRPLRSRAIPAFLFLTAVLPLGGLAVPAWIFIRERLWPHLLEEEMARRLRPTSAP